MDSVYYLASYRYCNFSMENCVADVACLSLTLEKSS